MAHGYVKTDPAVERWNLMREDVYKHFRFTSRATLVSLCGLVLVPGALVYISAKTDLRWKWNAKLKGEPLSVKPTNID